MATLDRMIEKKFGNSQKFLGKSKRFGCQLWLAKVGDRIYCFNCHKVYGG
jgi:hypothetical protein